MNEEARTFRIAPAYNLDLFTQTHRVRGTAAVLRDERLQLTASPSGELQARPVRGD
ncbi:MAG: hypothetical protein R8F63_08110 [Acidimicrobiales bacterium]|nr:hypothetical protein [Acidimicrobiales bacterium]